MRRRGGGGERERARGSTLILNWQFVGLMTMSAIIPVSIRSNGQKCMWSNMIVLYLVWCCMVWHEMVIYGEKFIMCQSRVRQRSCWVLRGHYLLALKVLSQTSYYLCMATPYHMRWLGIRSMYVNSSIMDEGRVSNTKFSYKIEDYLKSEWTPLD